MSEYMSGVIEAMKKEHTVYLSCRPSGELVEDRTGRLFESREIQWFFQSDIPAYIASQTTHYFADSLSRVTYCKSSLFQLVNNNDRFARYILWKSAVDCASGDHWRVLDFIYGIDPDFFFFFRSRGRRDIELITGLRNIYLTSDYVVWPAITSVERKKNRTEGHLLETERVLK